MPSKYSILQFSPNPLAEEKMNFGVVVWDDRSAEVRFVKNWDRLKRFARDQLPLVQQFATDFENKFASADNQSAIGIEIERMFQDWNHDIQLTAPRGSTEPAQRLLERMALRYLPTDAPHTVKRGKTRRSAAADANRALRNAVEKQLPGRVDELVRLRATIEGDLQLHQFDVVLANGKTIAAIDGLSFAVGSAVTLQRDVDAIAWALDDVRKKARQLPLAVYAVRPTTAESRAIFKSAQEIYEGLDAKLIVSSAELKQWSSDQVSRITRKAVPTKAPALEQV